MVKPCANGAWSGTSKGAIATGLNFMLCGDTSILPIIAIRVGNGSFSASGGLILLSPQTALKHVLFVEHQDGGNKVNPMKLSKFSDKQFIQEALRNPWSPISVLSFMFGADYNDPQAVNAKMHSGRSVMDMREIWFPGNAAFDKLCQPFSDVVRAAGHGKLTGIDWNHSVDGKMAQLILCDQLSRSAFRGLPEAFEYDERSLVLARILSDNLLRQAGNNAEPLSGTFYPPYLVFLLTALMHSESAKDHEQLSEINDYAATYGPPILLDWFDLMHSGGEAHTRVIDRFGRYPHRNAAKGRINTPEEEAWLADVDNLPGWAKSQKTS